MISTVRRRGTRGGDRGRDLDFRGGDTAATGPYRRAVSFARSARTRPRTAPPWRSALFALILVLGLAVGPSPAVAAGCPCSLFAPTATPASPAVSDGTPIEIGMKFRADADGFITGLRFYKGAANTGTHIGHLWTADGTMLAEATFVGETSSGWQQVQLAQPVPVTANTTYVVSYWSQSGYFAFNTNFFNADVDNAPLRAPSTSSSGGNGVYRYTTSPGFPTSTYMGSNYWVDVVYASDNGPDTTAPSVTVVAPGDGASAVSVDAQVTAVFSEPIDQATLNSTTFRLRDANGSTVAAEVTYAPGNLTATLTPQSPLDYSTAYTATVQGGTGGVTDAAGNALAEDRSWTFTTATPPPPPPDQGPGGPILVVTSSADHFGGYVAEMLRTEGLNEFSTTDVSNLNAGKLADRRVVILGRTALTDAQVATLTTWVQDGGKLIALRPDARLAGLLGITSAGGTLTEGYVKVDTTSAPGAGITGATMQFHGTADRYIANGGTRTVATLYTDATTTAMNPAVTLRDVGGSGGRAAAFTYDLGRSVVYTHQGNPEWAGQDRDGAIDQGSAMIRSDDLFFGGSLPDFVNLDKVGIPQADEQQRLLANLVTDMASETLPLPRLWYLPHGYKAAVVLTGDEHGTGNHGTEYTFDRLIEESPAGCSVADWECLRGSSYVYADNSVPPATAKLYENAGFELGLHLVVPGPNECDNFTSYAQLKGALDEQLDGSAGVQGFSQVYPSLKPPATIRTHCVAWSDWDSQVRADLSRGIRLNTDYYYWPSQWVQDRSGMFTGAGIPMRFAATDGSMYDVYQAATQLPDETFNTAASMGAAVSSLLDGAIGPNEYYGAFTTNVHNDTSDPSAHAPADAIIDAAKARGVPVISARQLLEWLDGRNASSFEGVAYADGRLTFTLDVGVGARGLQAMVPAQGPNGSLQELTRNGVPVATTPRTVKGIDYAVFSGAAGAYEATYAPPPPDTTPPAITNVAATAPTTTTATITWKTDEASTSRVDYGTSAGSLTSNVSDDTRVTDHSVTLTGLTPGTAYFFRVTSADAAGNSATSPKATDPPATVTTPIIRSVTDTNVADFSAGTPGTSTFVGASDSATNGEVVLLPTIREEFSGATLPSGWASTANVTGGTSSVSGGALRPDGARAGTTATYAPSRSLEFVGTLTSTAGQHIGFGTDFVNAPWAMFSTGGSGLSAGLYARSRTTTATRNTTITGISPSQPHRYRIVWNTTSITFFIDGVQVASQASAITSSMRPLAGDPALGGSNPALWWLRMSPYATSGTYTSRVIDGGTAPVTWQTLAATQTAPSGTTVTVQTRSGGTATPDASWSAWTNLGTGGAISSPGARYLQYRATMTTTSTLTSPAFEAATVTYRSG